MKKTVKSCLFAVLCASIISGCAQGKAGKEGENGKESKPIKEAQKVVTYTMPDEKSEHEGTWLQWPHGYTYGENYKKGIEHIWVKMASALSEGEKVHIVAYNQEEKEKISKTLASQGVNMNRVDFFISPTDDVWTRDNGPIFVYDQEKKLKIWDPGFNGWGKKTPFEKDASVREHLSKELKMERIDSRKLVIEGGAIELDGNGTFLSTRSSVVNKNRNPDLSEAEIEKQLSILGVKKFIWLDGVAGTDITDFHIDGFAKFYDKSTIITFSETDLAEWGLPAKDIKTLLNSTNASGEPYKYVNLPLSKNNVTLDSGEKLDYKGSYVNFYIGNKVVLVPNYNDPNDKVANDIIQKLYPERKVVGIDVRELYKDGGMIHCVTQQQPIQLK
ncbi:agmatine deiminase family protein [Paenibacillus sp. MZ04-78.2]|uniref:agmatine deiminase family protein n=1 Tax=Paenibacillus sp. MZ04-78.2 TaxID=2962034 RepID=UPI0020B7345C|nr:agmatine deiminase family protein [Paenibacillus sp. MZ04-78.2]MCP3775048.1 agmatine deiminase family protein [Paenibacillus sp. MZ04-78.2]